MISGIGLDIIEIERIAVAIKRPLFIKRVFTLREQQYCDSRGKQRSASYAARFAGKEAVMKALGTGLAGGRWLDIEILTDASGQPYVTLTGAFAGLAGKKGISAIHLSLTHAQQFAAAQVVLETKA